jgi:hypothetical protein
MTEFAFDRASATTLSCPEICLNRELSDELQVTELSWRSFNSALLESIVRGLWSVNMTKGRPSTICRKYLMESHTAMSSWSYGLYFCWVGLSLWEQKARGWQVSQTRCCKVAPIPIPEASVNTANVADGSGWARSVARKRLALQSSKAWTMVGVQSTSCDLLTLGLANAAWSGACILAACGTNRR